VKTNRVVATPTLFYMVQWTVIYDVETGYINL